MAMQSAYEYKRQAQIEMFKFFRTNNPEYSIDSRLEFCKASKIKERKTLGTGELRDLKTMMVSLLNDELKNKQYLVPLRGGKAFRKLPLHSVKSINGVVWYVFNISTSAKMMLAGFKAIECVEVE